MNRLRILGILSFIAGSAACASADPDRPTAADATVGVWGGTITTDGETNDISYVVRLQKGRSTAQVVLPAHGDQAEQQIPMRNLRWDGTNLDYAWATTDATSLNCQMVRQSDTLLSGSCWGGDGQRVLDMTMTPPPGRLERL